MKCPIFIINFNRLGPTKQLVADLSRIGCDMDDVWIADSASTYPPLLEWYKKECPCHVIRSETNVGKTLVRNMLADKRLRAPGRYVLTDGDITLPGVPADLLDVLYEALSKYPGMWKAGPGLRLDDIPAAVPKAECIKGWEAQFWRHKIDFRIEAYKAPIDTTFAMYQAELKPVWSAKAIRVCGEYVARHDPWYYVDMPADEAWLRAQPNRPSGTWSGGVSENGTEAGARK